MRKRKFLLGFIVICTVLCLVLAGCDTTTDNTDDDESTTSTGDVVTDVEDLDTDYQIVEDDYVEGTSDGSDYITFASSGITGNGVVISGRIATIKKAGSFVVSGTGTNNQIVVDAAGCEVYLILDNLTLTSSDSSAILIKDAEKVTITVKDGTQNTITDSATYASDTDIVPTACVYSCDDITINGKGTLTINGNYNNALQTKNVLKVVDVTLNINSVDDGILAKDCFNMASGSLTIKTTGDGIRSSETDSDTQGVIVVSGGNIVISSKGDGLQACNSVVINGGTFTITSGGGVSGTYSSTTSQKGIKGTGSVSISGGTFTINSADDALHSKGSVSVSGGDLTIKSGDDGIHADSVVTISDGTVNITACYEGVEAENITVNGGDISIVSTDDGFNVAGGNDSSAAGGPGGYSGSTSSSSYLTITGGYIFVNSKGDGLDSNGSIIMSGGTVIVMGPTDSGNGTLDYDGTFKLTGGYLLAVGSSGMLQTPTASSSTQYTLSAVITSSTNLIHIEDSSGNTILTYKPTKSYSAIVFSTPDIEKGETYKIYSGGSTTGTATNGLYPTDATYTQGTLKCSITVSSIVSSYGSSSGVR